MRKLSLLLLALTLVCVASWQVLAQKPADPQWIWFDEGNPLAEAPSETRYFRRVFTINRPVPNPVDSATVEITADNTYTLWVNGTQVGSGKNWQDVDKYDVKKHLRHGENILAVQAGNEGGPAGLVVKLSYIPNGRSGEVLVSDGKWKTSKTATKGWQAVEFDDKKWTTARVLGTYGKVGPWVGKATKGGPRQFTVPEGFRIEQIVKNPGNRGPFSLVNMTFDSKGRLLLSEERGGTLIAENPDEKGVFQSVRVYCEQVKNSHGMCCIGNDLYLVGNGPKGTGLYRCRDTKGEDRIDEVTLLHRFEGGMGEHGPHAVIHGPDGWLYVVAGNHAFIRIGKDQAPNPVALASNSPLMRWPTGGQGPDQGKPGSTEDVLLPRLDDARGHAAGLRAPGGTIWRMDLNAQNPSLVTAGFRNQFDAAFNPDGELFSFDSDMEWDEGLPWYRDVRIMHCPPGSDFLWRTGAANTPNYYLDSLPPLHETGRGSPVGVAVYDHPAFGERYRGAVLLADWSIGVLYALLPKIKGATYGGEVEKFCFGTPMNITDVDVGPDGGVYFTMGGRNTQGGVYRIIKEDAKANPTILRDRTVDLLARSIAELPQPQSAWSRARVAPFVQGKGTWNPERVADALVRLAADDNEPLDLRVAALTAIPTHGLKAETKSLHPLLASKEERVRAQAVWLLGIQGQHTDATVLEKTLVGDPSPFVKRRTCEALIRLGIEPKVESVWPLLGVEDPYLRTAARLVLQRIDPAKWVARLQGDSDHQAAWQGIVALCKTGQADKYAANIFTRLAQSVPTSSREIDRIDWLRTVQLACFHIANPPEKEQTAIATQCDDLFPRANPLVNRELAILLAHFRRTGVLKTAVHAKLIDAILTEKESRPQQIHYFYCLRFLHEGWTPEQQAKLAAWYESTRDWKGGASFTPFLENIFRQTLLAYDAPARRALLAKVTQMPQVNLVLAQRQAIDRSPELLADLKKAAARVATAKLPRIKELQTALNDASLKTLIEHPRAEYLPDLIAGLGSNNKLIVFECLSALQKLEAKPKPDDAASYRAALMAANKLDAPNRWKVVEVLRHWSNDRQFGSDKWQPELQAWGRWYAQAFPKEPTLPGLGTETTAPSKYKFPELLAYLTTGPGKTGDVKRGQAVFEKAACSKCHKYGKVGEGVGPDLTTLSKRFKRADTLESLLYPSKVISDQYRSTSIVTKRGVRLDGLVAINGDEVTVLQQDASKVTLRKRDIEQQFASLVSVMPEKLLDELTLQEIADLFAYLESEPEK
jgi:putative heme-binding domain-containing protein